MIASLLAALVLSSATPSPVLDFVTPPDEITKVAPLDLLIELDRVNRYVNTHCDYTDQGDDNPWGRCGMKGWKGNCKDYALEKRAELLIAGLPARRMKIWFVFVPIAVPGLGTQEMGHAVLVVDNTWVLDNRVELVTHRAFQEAAGYQFVCAIPDRNLYDGPTRGGNDQFRCGEH